MPRCARHVGLCQVLTDASNRERRQREAGGTCRYTHRSRISYYATLNTKRRKMAFFEGCPVGWAGKGWLGGERLGGYPPELAWWTGGQGGGARARGGGGTHRSWPGGRGGRPRALVAGEGWGGRRGDGSSKEGGGLGLGWLFQRGASPQPSENRGE